MCLNAYFFIMNVYIPIAENVKNTERFKNCSHISQANYSLHCIIVCVVFYPIQIMMVTYLFGK